MIKKNISFKKSFLALCGVAIFTAPFTAHAKQSEEETVIVTKTETFTMTPVSDHGSASVDVIVPDVPKTKVTKPAKKTVKKASKKVVAKKKATTKKKTTKKVVKKKTTKKK